MAETVRHTVVSAPGKVILMGEHAVVYGHPAVVATIDLRLKVTASLRADDRIRIDLPVLGHAAETCWERVDTYARSCRESWLQTFGESAEGAADYRPPHGPPERLVLIALGETARLGEDVPLLGVDLSVESKLPAGSGFGSSAALAAGVAASYLRVAQCSDDTELLNRISLEVERRQHGAPSGVDHNAVIRGGLLWAQRNDGGELSLRHLMKRERFGGSHLLLIWERWE